MSSANINSSKHPDSIVPMFYEIRDPKTREFKGCLLGAFHNLTAIGRTFFDAPGIFGEASKVQKCFNRATTFASEISFPDLDSERIQELVNKTQSIDGKLELEAFSAGKKCVGLEINEEREMPPMTVVPRGTQGYRHHPQCPERIFSSNHFLTGSESEFIWEQQNCTPTLWNNWINDRNKNMARRANILLQHPGVSFMTIGAMHLAGDAGVCNLLRKDGWEVTRVFEDSNKS